MLLHKCFFPSPSSNQLQAGRKSICLRMQVVSQVPDTSVSQVCWAPQESHCLLRKGMVSPLPPITAPDQIPPGSKAGSAPWRHRSVRLSCVSVGMWYFILLPPSHHPGGRKSFVDSQALSQAVSRTLKFHSFISSWEKPWSLHCTRPGSSDFEQGHGNQNRDMTFTAFPAACDVI